MISVVEAQAIISNHSCTNGTNMCALEQALGAIAAEDVFSKLTLPPCDVSAMDGYAVKLKDAGRGQTFFLKGESKAGLSYKGDFASDETIRIFTGARVPVGADHVVIQEHCSRDGDTVTIEVEQPRARNIRKAGIDFKAGDKIIEAGTLIGPAHIALAAAANHHELCVYKRPKVAVLASGDELRTPGEALKDDEIVNSNGSAISSLITAWGGEAIDMGIAEDSVESIVSHIQKARDADIIVAIGGASVGDYDYMKKAFQTLNYESVFSKVAIKPGKPTWFGRLEQQSVLGLPGNPASAYVCAHIFLKSLIIPTKSSSLALAALDKDLPQNKARETYLRGKVYAEDGRLKVTPFPMQDSSLITPLAAANTLIKLRPEDGPWSEGDMIEVIPMAGGASLL